MGSGNRRRSIEPRFIFAALATVVLVPFVIADLTGGSGDDAVDVTAGDDTAEAADTDAETAADEDGAETADPDADVSVELNPEWLGRGMSRYGESDEATTARIERWSKLSAGESVADLPQIDEVAPPPKDDDSTDGEGTPEVTVDRPPESTTPPTSPPATAAPTTAAPTTAAPTTAAPTTTKAPTTTTTKVAPTTTVAAAAGDG